MRYIRYRPGKNLCVHYVVDVDGVEQHAVAMASSKYDLSLDAADPAYDARIALVAGRTPATRPLLYDAEAQALLQWLPFDIDMPALAEPPSALRERLVACGIDIPARSRRADTAPVPAAPACRAAARRPRPEGLPLRTGFRRRGRRARGGAPPRRPAHGAGRGDHRRPSADGAGVASGCAAGPPRRARARGRGSAARAARSRARRPHAAAAVAAARRRRDRGQARLRHCPRADATRSGRAAPSSSGGRPIPATPSSPRTATSMGGSCSSFPAAPR